MIVLEKVQCSIIIQFNNESSIVTTLFVHILLPTKHSTALGRLRK